MTQLRPDESRMLKLKMLIDLLGKQNKSCE